MKIKSGFVLEKVGGEYLAVAVGERAKEFSGFIRLNSSGAYFWKLLSEADLSEADLVSAAMRDFEGVAEAQLERDIKALVKTLLDGGMIEA